MRVGSVLSRWKRLPTPARGWGLPALVTSVAVTALLLGIRQMGLLMPLELKAFDQLMRQRSALTSDPRVLVVAFTEADLQTYKWPVSDAVMHALLEKLLALQPEAIGLDIYRDVPVKEGNQELLALLQKSDRVIPVCKVSDAKDDGVPPPPGVPVDGAGFSDTLVDPDGVVRRGLLFLTPPENSPCATPYSLSFQLAQRYLEKNGIAPQLNEQQQLYFGDTIFKPLEPNDGGYQNIDAAGYQILLNYREPFSQAKLVTLTDVLNGKIDPSLVKGRIVLIGTTAPSRKDLFSTPYSIGQQDFQKMPGVLIHAQLTSQTIGTVLDGRPLFWFWPEWEEYLWIWVWSLTGGALAWWLRRPGYMVLAEGTALGVLLGTSHLIFMRAGWVPVATPILALFATSAGVLVVILYKTQQEQKKIITRAEEQKAIINELKQLLLDSTGAPTQLGEAGVDEETRTRSDDETALGDNPRDGASSTSQAERTVLPRTEHNAGDLLSRRYRILQQLGKGGFGITYLAEDTKRPGNPKCVVKHLMLAHRDEQVLKVARRLFRSEADILEKLRYPQIPKLLAFFEENKEFYIVQEFIAGHPLSRELPVNQPLPESFVVALLQEILEILAFIHNCNVIHRDLKPDNIIRREKDTRLVLIDFGAVKYILPPDNPSQGSFTVSIGTRGYAPPEQFAGQPNFSSDIYALGMIGIQALTGKAPKDLTVDMNTGNISWREFAPPLREEFAQILDKMVRYRYPDRYQSAAAVLQDLQRLAALHAR